MFKNQTFVGTDNSFYSYLLVIVQVHTFALCDTGVQYYNHMEVFFSIFTKLKWNQDQHEAKTVNNVWIKLVLALQPVHLFMVLVQLKYLETVLNSLIQQNFVVFSLRGSLQCVFIYLHMWNWRKGVLRCCYPAAVNLRLSLVSVRDIFHKFGITSISLKNKAMPCPKLSGVKCLNNN